MDKIKFIYLEEFHTKTSCPASYIFKYLFLNSLFLEGVLQKTLPFVLFSHHTKPDLFNFNN